MKCARNNCGNFVLGRPDKLYCSRRCKEQEKKRRGGYSTQNHWHKNHPECRRKAQHNVDSKKSRGYGVKEFKARIEAQGNRCPIGNHLFSAGRGFGANNPAQDHCHRTGLNRSIICNRHNMALGQFEDSPAQLLSALDYILSWMRKHLQ